jgi:hypothetical protein
VLVLVLEPIVEVEEPLLDGGWTAGVDSVLVLEPIVEVEEPLLAGGWTVGDPIEVVIALVLELAVKAEALPDKL